MFTLSYIFFLIILVFLCYLSSWCYYNDQSFLWYLITVLPDPKFGASFLYSHFCLQPQFIFYTRILSLNCILSFMSNIIKQCLKTVCGLLFGFVWKKKSTFFRWGMFCLVLHISPNWPCFTLLAWSANLYSSYLCKNRKEGDSMRKITSVFYIEI